MRDLAKVIEAVLNQVPEDFDEKEAFVEKMERTKDSAGCAEPETMQLHWHALMHHCNEHLKEPNGVKWKETVEGIVSGDLDYTKFL